MIHIKVIKASRLLYGAAVVVLLLLILIFAIQLLGGGGDAQTPSPSSTGAQTATPVPTPTPTVQIQDSGFFLPEEAVPAQGGSAQVVAYATGGALQKTVSALSSAVLQVDPFDPLSMLRYAFPAYDGQALAANAEPLQPDTPDDPDRIQVELKSIEGIYEPPQYTEGKPRPRVLLYHTHSYEAYEQVPEDPYTETEKWRTADRSHNIIGVGDKLTSLLEQYGVEVVHDVTEHEPPKLGTAYVRSLQTLQAYIDAGEEFDMIIDLHRDAASKANQNPSTVNSAYGECARLMVLLGTGERGFDILPDWKENYKLADALTTALNTDTPNLCREVMVKTGRYNQHIGTQCLLIEVGHNKNTLEQAQTAMQPLAKAIAQTLGAL